MGSLNPKLNIQYGFTKREKKRNLWKSVTILYVNPKLCISYLQSDYDRVQLESLKPDLMCSLDTTTKFIGWNKLSNEVSVVIVPGMYIMEHVD
ncbi:hypothetical protein P8452_37391 [Trifolium repens]|nr:hypothetical protein P8452_37391 [Trifolium repens]